MTSPLGRARALRVGVTGPIGCGKSTVARWLGAAGAVVVDADAIAREVTAPGEPAHDAVLARFPEAVAADGTLDRAALARIVFADPAALAALEAIVHPVVRRRILELLEATDRAGTQAVVIEAIKLVEGGLADQCDEVWLVTCDPTAQRARLRGRGMADEDVERRTSAQAELVARVGPRATRILDASGPPEETAAAAIGMLREALGRATA